MAHLLQLGRPDATLRLPATTKADQPDLPPPAANTTRGSSYGDRGWLHLRPHVRSSFRNRGDARSTKHDRICAMIGRPLFPGTRVIRTSGWAKMNSRPRSAKTKLAQLAIGRLRVSGPKPGRGSGVRRTLPAGRAVGAATRSSSLAGGVTATSRAVLRRRQEPVHPRRPRGNARRCTRA
jgi:hypothetical protein